MGIVFIFLYNFYAYLLRSVGNSIVPLYFFGSILGFKRCFGFIFCDFPKNGNARSSDCYRNFTRNCGNWLSVSSVWILQRDWACRNVFYTDCHFSWNKSCISLCLCTDYRRNSNLVGNSYRMASGGYGGTDILQKCLPIIY